MSNANLDAQANHKRKGGVDILVLVIVILTSIWVYFDAKKIGVKKGQLKGVANMGPVGWLIACLGLWIIAFPAYLIKRPQFKKINQGL